MLRGERAATALRLCRCPQNTTPARPCHGLQRQKRRGKLSSRWGNPIRLITVPFTANRCLVIYCGPLGSEANGKVSPLSAGTRSTVGVRGTVVNSWTCVRPIRSNELRRARDGGHVAGRWRTASVDADCCQFGLQPIFRACRAP